MRLTGGSHGNLASEGLLRSDCTRSAVAHSRESLGEFLLAEFHVTRGIYPYYSHSVHRALL